MVKEKSTRASLNLILVLLSLFLHARVFSLQKDSIPFTSFKISYKHAQLQTQAEMDARYQFGYSLQQDWLLNSHLFINDSMGFHYYTNERFQDQYRKKKPETVGDKIIHHATIHLYNERVYFEEVGYHGVDGTMLLKDTIRKLNWTFFDQTKRILGKTCYLAISVTEKQDSVLVWFTSQVPVKQNMHNYDGVPGLVMEVFDQRVKRHILAYMMEGTTRAIAFPYGIRIVSISEWGEIKKKAMKRT